MVKRTMDEMITHFNDTVTTMDVSIKDKMILLGMITAIGYEYQKAADTIEELQKHIPSADVAEVKHGKWLPSTCEYSNYNYDCSVCGCNEYRQIGRNGRYRGFDFCPNCGARMDGGT